MSAKQAWPRDPARWNFITTAVGVVVTAAGIAIFYAQWQTARSANDLTRQNFYLQQRAWVAPHFTSPVMRMPEESGAVRYNFEIRNSGQSVALRLQRVSQLYEYRIPADWKDVEQHMNALQPTGTEFYIPPGESVPVAGEQLHLQASDVVAIKQDHGIDVLMIGKIHYLDSLGSPRDTTFCVTYSTTGTSGTEGWTTCPIKQTMT